MVYVITSNTTELGEGVNTTGMNAPSSYINTLSSTLQIEPNSEIAVESIKINRSGNVSMGSANNQFYLYYGADLNACKTEVPELGDEVTSYRQEVSNVVHTWVRGNDGGNALNFDTNDLAQKIEDGFLAGLCHPNLLPCTSASGGVSVVRYDDPDVFKGFTYTLNQNRASQNPTGITHAPGTAHWFKSSVNDGGDDFAVTSNACGIVIAKTGSSREGISLIGQQYPLSLTGGSFVTYIDKLDHNYDWEIGLTRATLNGDQTESGDDELLPPFPSQMDYYDWVVSNEEDRTGATTNRYLYLDSMTYDGEPNDELSFSNVDYGNACLTASYGRVEFEAIGNTMVVSVASVSGTGRLYLSNARNTDATAKNHRAKPIGITTWHMFPKIRINEENGCAVVKEFQGLNLLTKNFKTGNNASYQYGGRFHENGKVTGDLTYQDWWATSEQLYQGSADVVDKSAPFDVSFGADEIYYRRLNGSGGIDGLTLQLITAPNTLYSDQDNPTIADTLHSNAENLLGFDDVSTQYFIPTHSASLGNKVIKNSATIPQMSGNKSLFVRLPQLPITSYNTGKGSLSKIIYHLPRFDNSGAEFGGLFFQPPERLYVPLNNTHLERLNNINVEVCGINEKQSLGELTGETIICFDIRKSRM